MTSYALYRFAGKPTEQRPVGMNDLLALGKFKSPPTRALYHLLQRVRMPLSKMRTFNTSQPVTHLGLYNFDTDRLIFTKEIVDGQD